MAAVQEQPAVSSPGLSSNKETGVGDRGESETAKLTTNGIDPHNQNNFDAAQSLKQKMSGAGGGDNNSPGPQPPNGSNSPHESNGGPGYPGQYPGAPGGYYPGYPPKGPGYPGHGPPYSASQPGPGGPTPTLNSLLQDRGQRFPSSYEGGPPPGPGGPGGPPGGPPAGYPGWGYQGHPQYRGQVWLSFMIDTFPDQNLIHEILSCNLIFNGNIMYLSCHNRR